MKKKTNKIIALILAVILSFSALPFTAFAGSIASISSDKTAGIDNAQNAKTEYSDTQISTGSVSTGVYLTVDNSDIIASVPTSIIMNGTPDENGNYIGKYSISATGDIAADKVVQIKPNDAEILLNQKGKNPKTATINQTETTFNYKDLSDGVRKNGSVTANSLTAGSWSAQTEFTLSIIDAPILDGYTALYEYDLSATDNDNVKAYYCIPNKNTIPIEQKRTMKSKVKSASALNTENSVIYNGVEYLLSDEDTLVVSGTGKMKENIQSELVDYASFYKDIIMHFNVVINFGIDKKLYVDENNNLKLYSSKEAASIDAPSIYFNAYGLYPITNSASNTVDGKTATEIKEYCKNYSDYAVSVPKTLIVKTGVENISVNAFQECISLEDVVIEYGVKAIEKGAFKGCINLTNISIPESVTKIAQAAFYSCHNLKELTIPTSVVKFGNQCFYDCTGLTELVFPDYAEEIGSSICGRCLSLKNCKLPKEVTKISGQSHFEDCKELTEIILPENLDCIYSSMFSGCASLTDINIPSTVKIINNYAFKDCILLTQINLPNSVTELGYGAFTSCSSLNNLHIPNSVTKLGLYLFNGCKSLKEVYIPYSVTDITKTLGRTNLGCSPEANTIVYCETQDVANLIYPTANTNFTVIIAPERF